MTAALRLDALLVGTAAPFGPAGKTSAIAKRPVDGPLLLGPEGFQGDEQADRRVHGGPDKAVHHYPRDHYAAWRDDLHPAPAVLDTPGAFGENLSTTGLTEADICIGDIWRLGRAVLQVAQGRQPCWKLNHRFGVRDMARRVQTTGRTGWYYRVLEPGPVAPGDALTLIDRPHADWPLTRLLRVLYVDTLDHAALEAMVAMTVLAPSWRTLAGNRLARGAVEDWNRRLNDGG